MTKFILLYKGPAVPMDQFTPEMNEQMMQAWGVWMGKMGSSLTDPGAPFAKRTGVSGDGTVTSASDLNGYSIVEAVDLAGAKALCAGHPFLAAGTGAFTVEIYELAPIDM